MWLNVQEFIIEFLFTNTAQNPYVPPIIIALGFEVTYNFSFPLSKNVLL